MKARCKGVVLAALACAFLFACTAPAGAATYTSSVSPNPFSYPGSQEIVYRLQVTTGAAPERLRVQAADGPSFPGGGGFLQLLDMTLEGPGTVVSSGRPTVVGDPRCSPAPVFPFPHGLYSFSTPFLEADIPANSTSVIALPGRLGRDAPWRTMDLAVGFRVGQPPADLEVIRSPNPVNNGRHGLPIGIRTDPAGLPRPCFPFASPYFPPPTVGLGREVLLTGMTDPVVAGQLMTIRTERLGESAKDIATVPIGGDGSFSYRWRPAAPGDYAIGAHYRSQSPGVTDDFSGTMGMRVTPPPARVRPTGITATRRVTCRERRCVIVVRGTVKRSPADASARCTGKLLLGVAAGKRRVLFTRVAVSTACGYRATRRFTLRSRRTRSVTVRVSYLGDPVVEPKRGPAVRVKVRRKRPVARASVAGRP